MAVAFYYGAKFDAKERCDAGQNLGIWLHFFSPLRRLPWQDERP